MLSLQFKRSGGSQGACVFVKAQEYGWVRSREVVREGCSEEEDREDLDKQVRSRCADSRVLLLRGSNSGGWKVPGHLYF